MPTRILRDWTDSERVSVLDWFGEVVFIRLIMKADDWGRFPANPKLLRSVLFPLKDGLRESDIARALAACQQSGLLRLYTVKDKAFLQIRNFKQRTRQDASKYPDPPDCQTSDGPMTDKCQTNDRQDVVVVGDVIEIGVEKDICPHDDFIKQWNELGSPFKKAEKWTPKRRAAFKERWADLYFRVNWPVALGKVKASQFCRGMSNTGWIADVDWFIRPDSVVRIMEGKYDGKSGNQYPAKNPNAFRTEGHAKQCEALAKRAEACQPDSGSLLGPSDDFAENGGVPF